MIIVIEGTDGCGKKTQTDLLYSYLKGLGYKVKKISFPNYESKTSSLVKMYLNGEFGENANDVNAYQTSTFYAVDRLGTMININVSEYDFVIMDRYVTSNMVHQSAKIDDIKELDEFLDWLNDFEYGKLKLPKPDQVLFLNVPVEVSIGLANQRKDLKSGEKKDIHEQDKNHLKIAYERGKYVANKYNWKVVDCANGENIKSINEIHEDILTKLGLK